MRRLVQRRILLGGLFVLIVGIFALTASAPAHSAHKSVAVLPPEEEPEQPACTISANPGTVMDIGEFTHHSSIATILEVECRAEYAEKFVRIASNELWSKCKKSLKWIIASPAMAEPAPGENGGKEIKAELDDEGNATVAVIGGPSCAPEGGALVTVDLESGTHPTSVTEVEILVPRVTPEGINLYPEQGAIESATDSSLLGLAVIEFRPGLAEEEVSVTDRQLFEKCKLGTKIRWFGEGGELVSTGVETHTLLDNNGNAFVVFEAGESCKSGNTLFEASLEEPPFTTLEANFKVLPPQPTFEEASFRIEKLQRLSGGGATFTRQPLTGELGETVEYEIIVHNTGTLPLTFSHFEDPNCEGIKGGPGASPVTPGKSTTYTCSHLLTSLGIWTNVATVEGSEGTGKMKSNEVVVNVPARPGFRIEKLQEIKGSHAGLTKEKLTAKIGETVDYAIVVTNTGNVPLKFSHFTDANCTNISGGPGASEVAPGASTTWECEHVLTAVGIWTNEATVEGNEGAGTKTSNEVQVKVINPGFKIEKLQRLAGEPVFTKAELMGEKGQEVEYEIIVTNTGDVPLKFSNFSDTECEKLAGGPGLKEVQPNASTTYTCERTLPHAGRFPNTATVEGNEGTGSKTSNEVVVVVIAHEPKYSIEKLQRLAGQPNFTKAELTAVIGETVEYEIIVTNIGNVNLKFTSFHDPNCEGIVSGATELTPGMSTIFTCFHKLTAVGTWINAATIEGNEGTGKQESNPVVANVPPVPKLMIEKLQQIKQAPLGFTKLPLKGESGQTVEYEIIVTNTGNVPLTLSPLNDPKCEGITGGPGATPLKPGESTTYTCSHLLMSTGAYTNVALIAGTPEGEPPVEGTSNTVEVTVPLGPVVAPRPGIAIEKLQSVAGSGKPYTNAVVDTELGATIDYKIIVTNTGDVEEALTLSDPVCDAGTLSGPIGTLDGNGELAPGASVYYLCTHLVKASDGKALTNKATVTATPASGPPLEVSSEVHAEIGKQIVKCAFASSTFALHGATGGKSAPFKVRVSAKGISKITFFLDRRKFKTLTAKQARHGVFTITIDPRRLLKGGHRVSAKITLASGCAGEVHSVFVHARSHRRPPNFTG